MIWEPIRLLLTSLLGSFISMGQYADKKKLDQEALFKKEADFEKEDLYKLAILVIYFNNNNDKYSKLKQKIELSHKNKNIIQFIQRSYISDLYFSLEDNVDSNLLKYLKEANYSFSKCVKLIKDGYKAKDHRAENFCKSIMKFKNMINSNNENTKEKISLSLIVDSALNKIDQLKKLMEIIDQINCKYYNLKTDDFYHYEELRKNLNILKNDLDNIDKYIKYLLNEIKYDLLYKKNITDFYSEAESSKEDNQKNKSKDFYPNFTKLIFFYIITGLSEEKNTNCEQMRKNLLQLILIIKDNNHISKQGLLSIFRKMEWMKFQDDDEFKKPYYVSSYWELKSDICLQIFGRDFFYNLDKDSVASYLKNYYIEEQKIRRHNAKNQLQNYFKDIVQMLNKKCIIELTKEYK